MKVTRSRKHHISMGNYEFIEVGAEITVEVPDDVDEKRDITGEVYQALTEHLRDEIHEASMTTAEAKSYIHFYGQES